MSTIGIPIKLLHEAQGHIVTVELTNGQVYRGKLLEGTIQNKIPSPQPAKSPFYPICATLPCPLSASLSSAPMGLSPLSFLACLFPCFVFVFVFVLVLVLGERR